MGDSWPTFVTALISLGLWCAFWLLAVNWQRAWPVLARGAWAPVVLLTLTSAMVWARIAPENRSLFNAFPVDNFWWQLACTSALAGAALFCGWLQGLLGWTPPEYDVEPTAGHAQASNQHAEGHEHA